MGRKVDSVVGLEEAGAEVAVEVLVEEVVLEVDLVVV